MGKNIMGYVMIADRKTFSGFYMIARSQLIADDRKRSQKIEPLTDNIKTKMVIACLGRGLVSAEKFLLTI